MSPAQKKAYATMVRELWAEVDGEIISIENVMAKATKLQCISSGFLYDKEGNVHVIGDGSSPKLEATREYLETCTGKTIIFAHYKPSIQLLIKAFPNAAYALSMAGMKPDELERQKYRFNNDPSCKLFIAPQSVMQYGHTLIGDAENPCTDVIYYENWWSRRARSQSQDRPHRWGAHAESILYCDMICSPIEKQVLRRLDSRGDLAQEVFNALKEFAHG
jgi:SNF2 family DNA or RNA helicase